MYGPYGQRLLVKDIMFQFNELLWKGPERVQYFLWLCFHDKLLTNHERVRWRMSDQSSCAQCTGDVEAIHHILRDCPSSMAVWLKILPMCHWQTFLSLSVEQWLLYNLLNEDGVATSIKWKTLFGTACWMLWKFRNATLF
ncbi:hypothetical protein RCOM_0370700 [Ricinus communis]|uniref:Reverse transcriptase zinc-binding domain-containing protein n=1 Tax=Ricinus communis TaxID=3988 RepID=B9T6V7_RICCO|nr:hypothetical protein RCOM_0370700 [Ricinus communis]